MLIKYAYTLIGSAYFLGAPPSFSVPVAFDEESDVQVKIAKSGAQRQKSKEKCPQDLTPSCS